MGYHVGVSSHFRTDFSGWILGCSLRVRDFDSWPRVRVRFGDPDPNSNSDLAEPLLLDSARRPLSHWRGQLTNAAVSQTSP